MIKIELKNNFNLDSTVTCGQIFRYYKLEDNSYDIILKDRVINVYKKDFINCYIYYDFKRKSIKLLYFKFAYAFYGRKRINRH